MRKRSGKPRGRPLKSDDELVRGIEGRPSGQSIEAFCEANAPSLRAAEAWIKRYHRIASEYWPIEATGDLRRIIMARLAGITHVRRRVSAFKLLRARPHKKK